MAKDRIISKEQLISHISNRTRTILWHGISVTIHYILPITEVPDFVNSVMNACYDEAHDVLMPEMMDFAFRVNVVTRYACVELPSDVNKQYEAMYCTDIFDAVMSVINTEQVQSIRDTIQSIMFRK